MQFGDSVTFSLSVTRTDDTFPVYNIILTASIYHPIEEVMVANFDPMLITTISHETNQSKTTLNLPQLSYATMEASMLQIAFNGTFASLAYTVPFIQLHGLIEYQSSPTNGHAYSEQITFPKVFVRDADFSLELINTSLELTNGLLLVEGEEALFRANITNIINFGPSTDLNLLVEVNGTYLYINSTEIVRIGYVAAIIQLVHSSKL